MPDIDLEPHEYSSKRSRRNANAHGLMALVAIGFLAWIWTTKDSVSTTALFAATVTFGACAGAGLIVFLNQWRGV